MEKEELSFGGERMLTGIFRTKERKVMTIILGLIIIVMGTIIIINYFDNRRFMEQAVMAENYLEAGNYDKAIIAYKKAISMKDMKEQNLAIGLAEAYIGIDEYDKALEVLRICYQKTSGINVKKKIEEVTLKKTEYEYNQFASRAEVYFSNQEYDKAIAEYENAKLVKSKEVRSYIRIAYAYIEKGEYEKAREEIIEGQILTNDENLEEILIIIDGYVNKTKYEQLLKQADEYISQENYQDGIAVYKEAIDLIPEESSAYIDLANVYLEQYKYEAAVNLLETAQEKMESKEIDDLLKTALELHEKR